MSKLCFQDRLLPALRQHAPDIAIQYRHRALTYEELDQRSQSVCNWLIQENVPAQSFIGVYIDDKIHLMAALIGIIKANCVFVPLDTSQPRQRLEKMVQAAQPHVIITHAANRNHPFSYGKTINRIYKSSAAATPTISPQYHREDKLFVTFTPGPDGTPRAVVGKNKSLLHYIDWEIDTFPIQESCRVSQLYGSGSDDFLADVFVPLCSGGTICIPHNPDIHMDGAQMAQWIDDSQIHTLHCTPGLFNQLNAEVTDGSRFEHLQYIMMTGETLNPQHLKTWFGKFGSRINLVNLYGTSETTIAKSCYFIPNENPPMENIPIGTALKGARLMVLDKQMNMCEENVIGEIYIRTPYRSYGYHNDPLLTQQRFVANPFTGDAADLFHKTGDLGRIMPDGNIEYMGRTDRRIKQDGVCFEPVEIESLPPAHPAIRETVVTQVETEDGQKTLCLYYVTDDTMADAFTETVTAAITRQISLALPKHLVPSHALPLKKIHRLPNGQIDFNALPSPYEAGDENMYTEPAGELEAKLLNIWAEVLELDETAIGIEDSFFDFKGQSLEAIMMTSLIHREMDIRVPIHVIFELSTIRQLACYIKTSAGDKFISIQPTTHKEFYPLSPGQKRLYIIQAMESQSIGYNVPQIAPLQGTMDPGKVEFAFRRLIHRHESFRTTFTMVEDQPVQKIHQNVDFNISYFQLALTGTWDSPDVTTAVNGIITDFIRPFNLDTAPLLRVAMIRLDDNHNILIADMHHIISDAASRKILLKDFLTLYENQEPAPLRLQYKDYSQWINSPAQRDVMKTQEVFWLDQMAGDLPMLDLPADFPRPEEQTYAGDSETLQLEPSHQTHLQQLALEESATLFMVILAVYNIFLSKTAALEDIIIGTPVSGRRHADLENIIGIFVNTLALRNYPRGNLTFREFLKAVRKTSFDAFENQHYQFEDLVDQLPLHRNLNRNPIFDVFFTYQEDEKTAEAISRTQLTLMDTTQFNAEGMTAKFDLVLGVSIGDTWDFHFQYRTHLFKKETVCRFAAYFKNIVHHIVHNPDSRLADIDILHQEEKEQLLYHFNDTVAQYPADKTIHALFRQQAQKAPHRIAVVGASTPTDASVIQLTYRQFDQRTDAMAHMLKARGVVPGTIVAIRTSRSVEMMIALLATLKAGGAYMPIPLDYPQQRIDYMLADSGCKFLITTAAAQQDTQTTKNWTGSTILPITSITPITPITPIIPTYPAYIIYTSGSTGRPKGVIIEHSAVANILHVLQDAYPMDASSSYLMKTSYLFDVSVTELFGWFMGGGRLVLLENEAEKDPRKILHTMETFHITHINFVPSMFNVFLDLLNLETIHRLSCLTYLFLAGEALLPTMVKKFRKTGLAGRVRLENLYGPSEATVYAGGYSVRHWREGHHRSVPIGKPLGNIRLYVLNEYSRLQPVGVVGELCISGLGLARGYLNRPQLTHEKFTVSRLLMENQSTTLYHTGDLARWLPDGNIEFLGRMDNQVKIRGFRVELGELENLLLRIDGVKDAAAAIIEADGQKRVTDSSLCAYIVPAHGNLEENTLRRHLEAQLPHYMVPTHILQLEAIPLTASGKINRRSLPQPELQAEAGIVVPRDEIETKLAALWASVLGIETDIIGIHSNFFNLGGHSLRATQMSHRVQQEFQVELPMGEIFKRPTVEKIADFIKEAAPYRYASIPAALPQQYYTLSSAQERLYFLYQSAPDGIVYNMPQISSIKGPVDKGKFQWIFEKLIRHHEGLRTSFKPVDKNPVQEIHDPDQVSFAQEYYQLPGGDPIKIKAIINDFIRPFDLSRPPLMRTGLIEIDETTFIWLIDIHHIVSDGVTQWILMRDFSDLYQGYQLTAPTTHYKDFSQWQNKRFADGGITPQETYWVNRFKDGVPLLELPTDLPRPAVKEFTGADVGFNLGLQRCKQLYSLAEKTSVTLYMLLLAVYSLLLSKYSGQEDIVTGSPVTGRTHKDLEFTMGLFVNMLAMRTRPCKHKTFRQFLQEVKQDALDAFENQEYQFPRLVKQLGLKRVPNRNPLFDAVFQLNNIESLSSINISGLQIEDYGSVNTICQFDMILGASESGDDIGFNLAYSTELFKKDTAEKFTQRFVEVIDQIIDDENIKIGDIQLSLHLMTSTSTTLDKDQGDFDF